jgi:sigma-B regulation protein RsbU (phosphoserine phosphatase)
VADVRDCVYFDPEVDKRSGFRTVNALCMPIRDREQIQVAVLQLLNKVGGFTGDDMSFLELMGVHIAQAIANVQAQGLKLERQRLARELELAAQIQTQLLPRAMPDLPGLELAARILPCHEIGGDYYDAVPLSGGRTLLVVADVSGKGVPAALVMSNLQAALWATTGLDLTLEAWAGQLGEMLHHRLAGLKYVTGCFVLMAEGGRSGRCLNAGHPPVLIAGAAGVRRMAATGVPLGLLPQQSYGATEFTLAPGETLLLYTDGLTDASDAQGNPLEIEGVERLLLEAAPLSAEAAAEKLMAAIHAYSPPGQDCDDRTILLAKAVA